MLRPQTQRFEFVETFPDRAPVRLCHLYLPFQPIQGMQVSLHEWVKEEGKEIYGRQHLGMFTVADVRLNVEMNPHMDTEPIISYTVFVTAGVS